MFFDGSARASGAIPRCGRSPATILLIRRMRGSYFNCAAAEVISVIFSPYIVTSIVELSCVSTVVGRKLIRAWPGAGAPTTGASGAVAGGVKGGAVAAGAVAGGAAVAGGTAAGAAGGAACAMAAFSSAFRGPYATLIWVALPAI